MLDHIAKPIDVDSMFATIAKWIKPRHPHAVPVPQPADRLTVQRAGEHEPGTSAPSSALDNIEGIDPSNYSYWNFGCTQQRNLAALVDTPADLVQPRGETPVYTARRAVVLDKYRKGEPTPTKNPEADKAKISEIAK